MKTTPQKPVDPAPDSISYSEEQASLPAIAITKDMIFDRIVSILHETFDIDKSLIVRQARLYDELDIDSIDAIDLIVQLKPLIGRRLQPEAFKSVRTIGDVVDALYGLSQGEPPP